MSLCEPTTREVLLMAARAAAELCAEVEARAIAVGDKAGKRAARECRLAMMTELKKRTVERLRTET